MRRTLAITAMAAIAAVGLSLAVTPAGAQPSQPPDQEAAASAATAADAHIASSQTEVYSGPDDRLVRTGVQNGTNGLQYVSYERFYRGLPVVGGDVVVMTKGDGTVVSTSVSQEQVIDIGTEPTVGTEEALATSREQLSTVEEASDPRLVVLTWSERPSLSWETTVTGVRDTTASKLHVFVDAVTGQVIGSYDEVRAGSGSGYYNGDVTISTSGSGSSYSMEDSTRPGIRCGGQNGRAYTGSDDSWGNGSGTSLETACVDALYAVQQEWDMLGEWFDRQGIDGDGGGFPARVGLNQANAYWNGSYTNFGHSSDGRRQATPIDVVAHEYGHAIFQHTPGGTGWGNENGGLNESTGDIFGALVEAYADNPSDDPDYLVGEEVDLAGNGPIRNMYDPSEKNHPNCYSSSIPNTEVHAAAGPLNHWFYLVAEGSSPVGKPASPICSGGPSSVTGIGVRNAGEVYYNALLQKTSSWRYVDVRVATLNAAKALYSTCTEFNRVRAAWDAVSVPEQSGEPTCAPDSANDFSVSVSPASATVDAGASVGVTVSTSTTKGAAQVVELSVSELPEGVTASFDPSSVTSGGSSELTLTTLDSTPGGTYSVTVTGTGSDAVNSGMFSLSVNGTSSCGGFGSNHSGSLSGGGVEYQPDGGYFYSEAGEHGACLDGPEGADFDVYLQKWNGSRWSTVDSGTTPGADEELSYSGGSGYYRYQIHAYSGSGDYTLGYNAP